MRVTVAILAQAILAQVVCAFFCLPLAVGCVQCRCCEVQGRAMASDSTRAAARISVLSVFQVAEVRFAIRGMLNLHTESSLLCVSRNLHEVLAWQAQHHACLLLLDAGLAQYSLRDGSQRPLAQLPTADLEDFAAVMTQNGVFTFGGTYAGSRLVHGVTYMLPLQDAHVGGLGWTELPPMSVPRRGASAVEVKLRNAVFVIGGHPVSHDRLPRPSVKCLNLGTMTWTTMPPLRISRAYAAVTHITDYVVVVGGSTGHSMELYSLILNSWQLLDIPSYLFAAYCISHVLGSAAVALADEVFVFGGWDKSCRGWGDEVAFRAMKVSLSQIVELPNSDYLPLALCLDDGEIVELPNMPSGHDYFPLALCLDDGAIYVFGGSKNSSVSKFEPFSGRWRILPQLLSSNSGCYAGRFIVVPSEHRARGVPEAVCK